MKISRRQVMTSAGAATLLSFVPSIGRAQNKRITATTYAGAFDEAMQNAFVKPFVERTGIQVDFLMGNSLQWLSQVEASPQNPPIDVVLISSALMNDTAEKGLFEAPSVEKVPNMAHVDPIFVKANAGGAVAFNYGFHGIAYHKERVAEPPKTFIEFIERTKAGDWMAGLPGINYPATFTVVIWRLNQLLGGEIDDITPVIETLKEMRENTVFWANFSDFESQMQTGEIDISLFPDGRAWAMVDAGADWLGFYSPEEGGVLGPTAAAKPLNAKPEAWQFINELLDPKGQAAFADRMNYGMTNETTVYPDKFAARRVDWRDLTVPPFSEISARIPEWTERWNKEIGA
ncbi:MULTISPECIES: extracellular solute-binding protein [Chelativorans]|jgi:putative spermidine/putrescine transport system substrate-binding protein|uniref:Twin-arginine translocation pathway signal n=1 Tax=Chelativorans sp. (strain BNC1) TaxID=266779 RepID=Q11BW3_CHESB|nr:MULTISPECIES: extracellular solute-binding protein [Chelativorans]